jgi:hypothetical protein
MSTEMTVTAKSTPTRRRTVTTKKVPAIATKVSSHDDTTVVTSETKVLIVTEPKDEKRIDEKRKDEKLQERVVLREDFEKALEAK